MARAAEGDRAARHTAAILRDPELGLGIGQLAALQTVAAPLRVELTPIGVREAGEIERGITTFARLPNGGMIVTASTPALVHRELITMLAARHRLPAVYAFRYFVTVGGLMSTEWNRSTPTGAQLPM